MLYAHLCYENKTIGITAFHDDYIKILDINSGMVIMSEVKQGTVVIDKSLIAKRNLRRCRFTLGHESAHWLLHRKAIINDSFVSRTYTDGHGKIAAKIGRIDYSRNLRDDTDESRIERQADFLSSAILMPRPALRIAYRDFFKAAGEKPRVLTRGKDKPDDLTAKNLATYMSDMFNVSHRAAMIRLEKLNAVEYHGSRRQPE